MPAALQDDTNSMFREPLVVCVTCARCSTVQIRGLVVLPKRSDLMLNNTFLRVDHSLLHDSSANIPWDLRISTNCGRWKSPLHWEAINSEMPKRMWTKTIWFWYQVFEMPQVLKLALFFMHISLTCYCRQTEVWPKVGGMEMDAVDFGVQLSNMTPQV